MVQPNTEAWPRRSRTRRGEEQAPLVEFQPSVVNNVIIDGEGRNAAQRQICTTHKVFCVKTLFSLTVGIDGPAAFMGSEGPDLRMKIENLSASQSQTKSQTKFQNKSQNMSESRSQSQSPSESQSQFQVQSQSRSPAPSEEPERDRDTESLLEPKTDIHELLQKQGESWESVLPALLIKKNVVSMRLTLSNISYILSILLEDYHLLNQWR